MDRRDDAKLRDVSVNITRLSVILGVLIGAVVLLTAAKSVLDDRYARRDELQRLDGKLDRVLDVMCSQNFTRACQP